MRIGGIRADAQFCCPIFNKQLDNNNNNNNKQIDLMIFKVFLYLDDPIDNIDDNVQEVEKQTEVCRDLFRFHLVFHVFQDASYNLRIVIFNRTAFRQSCCPNLIQSIIPRRGQGFVFLQLQVLLEICSILNIFVFLLAIILCIFLVVLQDTFTVFLFIIFARGCPFGKHLSISVCFLMGVLHFWV